MLTVEGLSFGFRNQLLFKKISFSLKPSELIHITGSNGTGKTSLLNVLAGLYIPNEGSYKLASSVTREYLASESNAHFLAMPAVDNLRFWAGLRGRDLSSSACEDILSQWHIPKAAVTTRLAVGKFSTGMKRKLALIRLACSQANLWLVDEPTLGLDHASVGLFTSALKAHLSQGGACVLVSHEASHMNTLITHSFSLNKEGR